MKASITAEFLAPYLRNFVGSRDGKAANWAFGVLCSTNGCYSEAQIPAKRHSLKSEKHKLDAAERLVQKGWTCPKRPLCPDCSRKNPPS